MKLKHNPGALSAQQERLVKMKRQTLFGVLLAMCTATSMSLAQQGPDRLRVPEDMLMPYYARIAVDPTGTEIYHDDTWAAIVFYYNPEHIPNAPDDPSKPFNLLGFFDFRLLTGEVQVPMTVSGFWLWDSEAMAVGEGPSQSNIHGNGAVSVWFVSWPELEDAVTDGELTVPELKSLPSLKKGTATVYNEELQPSAHITINALGQFDGGGRFQFHATGTASRVLIRIRIW